MLLTCTVSVGKVQPYWAPHLNLSELEQKKKNTLEDMN